MRAAFADELVGEDALEQILDHLVLFLALDQVFHSVHRHVKELVHVFLDHRIDWAAVNVLESRAEVLRVEILSLNFHEPTKDHFELVQYILFIGFFSEVRVFHF